MIRMILRMDSKRRITLPATLVPWKPGDYVDVTYIEREDVFVARRVKPEANPLKVLKRVQSRSDGTKTSRKKKKSK